MPVRKVKDPANRGRACYQWGHSGRVYCGSDARAKATAQGRAVKARQSSKVRAR